MIPLSYNFETMFMVNIWQIFGFAKHIFGSIGKGIGLRPIFGKRVFTMFANMSAMLSCKIYVKIWNNTHISEHMNMNMSENTERASGSGPICEKRVFTMLAHMFALLPGKIYTNMWNNTNKSEHITMNMSEKHRKGHRALDLFLKNVFLQCSHTCSRCFLAKYM